MRSLELDNYRHAIRLGLAVSAMSWLSACGLLEHRSTVTACSDDRQTSRVSSEEFLSFDKSKMATLRCEDGMAVVSVHDLGTDQVIFTAPTRFTFVEGLKVYWSMDATILWVTAPSQSAMMEAFDVTKSP